MTKDSSARIATSWKPSSKNSTADLWDSQPLRPQPKKKSIRWKTCMNPSSLKSDSSRVHRADAWPPNTRTDILDLNNPNQNCYEYSDRSSSHPLHRLCSLFHFLRGLQRVSFTALWCVSIPPVRRVRTVCGRINHFARSFDQCVGFV